MARDNNRRRGHWSAGSWPGHDRGATSGGAGAARGGRISGFDHRGRGCAVRRREDLHLPPMVVEGRDGVRPHVHSSAELPAMDDRGSLTGDIEALAARIVALVPAR